MNHYLSGIIKLVLLEASVGLWLLDAATKDQFAKAKRVAYVALAAAMLFAWSGYGGFRGTPALVHTWEQFHFYLGAKYQTEVGWFDLYRAVLLADRESANVLSGVKETRNLHTFEPETVEAALAQSDALRARFSDARWNEFKSDWVYFAKLPIQWAPVLMDHGNSNSPAWAILASPLTRLLPLSVASQTFLGALDMLLMVALWAFAAQTFGLRATAIGLVVFAAPINVFEYTAGSILRWDWLFACGMALCFLARGRYAWAGAFWAYAVATKLFPLLFGAALAFHWAWLTFNTRTLPRATVRFSAGAAASGIVIFALASAMFGGPGAWADYKRRIDVTRDEKYYGIQYSLKTVFLQVVESSPRELLQSFPGKEVKQARADVDIRNHALSFVVVQLLFSAIVALWARKATDASAFALGPVLVFIWLTVNMYYWCMLGLIALGLALRTDRPSFGALLGLPVTLGALYVFQHLNRGWAEGLLVGSLWTMGLLAVGISLAFAYSRESTKTPLPSRTRV